MDTYTTIDGRTLDLAALSDEERSFLACCYAAYREGIAVDVFDNTYVNGPANPLLRATGGWVTRRVWEHPLYRAVHDLGDRLGIKQGTLAPEGEPDTDPFADAWLSTTEAARRKGVSLTAIHKAIRRGDLLARPVKPNGAWLRVSANSLAHWTPNPIRQTAARRRAAVVR